MDQFISALPAVMRAAGDVDEVATAAAQAAWKYVVGGALQSQTLVTGLHEKRLTVAVGDVVWQRQLESMSGQLLYRLNAALGRGTIKFIEFRIEPTALPERGVTKEAREPESNEIIATELVAAAASINKPDLRRSFLAAAGSSLRRRRTPKRSDNS